MMHLHFLGHRSLSCDGSFRFNYLLYCLEHVLLQIGRVKLEGEPGVGSFINSLMGSMGLGTLADLV